MSGPLFIIVLLVIFFFLGFIVPSSSGLAVLSMPIFAPLADTVGIPRFVIVTTYQFGQYAMLFLHQQDSSWQPYRCSTCATPTG